MFMAGHREKRPVHIWLLIWEEPMLVHSAFALGQPEQDTYYNFAVAGLPSHT